MGPNAAACQSFLCNDVNSAGACEGRASLKEFCGKGYVDSDKQIANVIVIIKELW